MARVDILKPVYVQYIPPSDSMKNGEIYISREFHTVIHKCCCGCGEEVVTPLNPAQWKITEKNGKVSLHPSIGNWSYPCHSHYIIKDNRVIWAGAFSEAAIKRVQARDQQDLDRYIGTKNAARHREDGLIQRFFAALHRFARTVRDIIRR